MKNHMPQEPEFAEINVKTKAEAIRFVVWGALAGGLVIVVSETWLFPWLGEFAESAPCRQVMGIAGDTVLAYGLFVGIPLHVAILVMAIFGWRGYKILRDGQFPPFKEKVFRPTRIQRGLKARLIGYLHISACLPLLALSVWGVFQAEKMIHAFPPTPGSCTPMPGGGENTYR